MLNTRTEDPDLKEVFTLIRIINNSQNHIREYAELIDFLMQKNMYYHAFAMFYLLNDFMSL